MFAGLRNGVGTATQGMRERRTLEIAIVNIDEGRDDLTLAEAPPPAAADLGPVISCAQLWADGTAYRRLK